MSETLISVLEQAAGSAEGVRFVGRREEESFFSYRSLQDRALRLAGGLARSGVRTGDRVAIVLPTGPAFYDAFFGALLAGAVPAPLYPPVRLGRLDEYHAQTGAMLRACRARIVLSARPLHRILDRAVSLGEPELGCAPVEELPQGDPVAAAAGPDDVALVQFSSGATSAPKPVALSHRQILWNVRAIERLILDAHPEGPDLTHRAVSWLPLYHDMGLVGSVLTALAHPGPLTLIPPELFVARPAIWLRAISRHRGTVSPAPNFAYALCADRIREREMEGVDLSSWRIAFNGAEPVTAATLERFIERFRPYGLREEALTPVYGLAEAGLAVSVSAPRRRFRARSFDRERLAAEGVAEPAASSSPGAQVLVSVGRPIAGSRIEIRDRAGNQLPSGRVGKVWVRSPSMMRGYFDAPETTAAVVREGWLDTGDLGLLHEGELYLYGRAKDLIVLHGRNYAPQEIELALAGVAGLRAGCAAAIGLVLDESRGEELLILAEHRRGAPRSEIARLSAAIRGRILEATGLVPRQIVVLAPGSLPRTSSGKIRRGESRKRFLRGALHAPRSFARLRLAVELIRARIAFRARP